MATGCWVIDVVSFANDKFLYDVEMHAIEWRNHFDIGADDIWDTDDDGMLGYGIWNYKEEGQQIFYVYYGLAGPYDGNANRTEHLIYDDAGTIPLKRIEYITAY